MIGHGFNCNLGEAVKFGFQYKVLDLLFLFFSPITSAPAPAKYSTTIRLAVANLCVCQICLRSCHCTVADTVLQKRDYYISSGPCNYSEAE